jgi:hypothetical protein
MPFTFDIATLASGTVNEDRAGVAGDLAWVIDGATDMVASPMTPAPTDASWIAEAIDARLREIASAPPADLRQLPQLLADRLRAAFERVARRQPAGRHEHPSASGMIVRSGADRLEFVAIGDCSLLVKTRRGISRIGTDEEDAGDAWVAGELTGLRAQSPGASADAVRAQLWRKLGAARAAMNEADGYGVFSITATPGHFIRHGWLDIAPGDCALLASDGLMRLIDVFRSCTAEELAQAAVRSGVASLIADVREREAADAGCIRFPRAKALDDATGVLLRFA